MNDQNPNITAFEQLDAMLDNPALHAMEDSHIEALSGLMAIAISGVLAEREQDFDHFLWTAEAAAAYVEALDAEARGALLLLATTNLALAFLRDEEAEAQE